MNWAKQNPMLTALLALTVVVLGAGFFVFSQQQAAYAEATSKLESQVAEANRLQALKPYPDKKNLDLATAEKDKLRDSVNGLQNDLILCNVPLGDISPTDFAAKLREINANNAAAAHERSVQWPQNFFMGFDAYSEKLPEAKAAPALNRQLEAINEIIKLLIDKSVAEIRSVSRATLPQEDPKLGDAPPEGLVTKTRFTVVFRADNGKTKDILNLITRTIKPYFVIRNVDMQNDVQELPRTQDAATPTPTPSENAATAPGPVARRLVGGEKVVTTLEIDVLTFGKNATPPSQGNDNKRQQGGTPKRK